MFTVQLALYGGGMIAVPEFVDRCLNSEVALQNLTRYPQKDTIDDEACHLSCFDCNMAETCHDTFLFHWLVVLGLFFGLVYLRQSNDKLLVRGVVRIVARNHQHVVSNV